MANYLTAVLIVFVVSAQPGFSQPAAIKIPEIAGNVNDWESLFTDAQKSSLDSVCTIFTFQTNIPIVVITFGAANTAKDNSDAFMDATDSILYTNNNGRAEVAIFLSKEFRALNFKANTPAEGDTSKYRDWKVKLQQVFTASVQPYIPLLKQGKYTEALILTIADLAVSAKKEF